MSNEVTSKVLEFKPKKTVPEQADEETDSDDYFQALIKLNRSTAERHAAQRLASTQRLATDTRRSSRNKKPK